LFQSAGFFMINVMKLVPSFVTLALSIGASTLSAQIVTYTIDGTITSVSHANSPSGLGSIFTKNENFELTFTGDVNTTPSVDLPALGLYSFNLLSGQITAGADTFSFDQNTLGLAQDFGATSLTFGGNSDTDDFLVTATLTSLQDLFPAGAFPTSLPALSEFNIAKIFTLNEYSQRRGNFDATGKITSIESIISTPVPEPSTYSLAAIGFLGAGALIRRRRRA
jgi:hypothetical protein